jgi:hypothetical protein
MKNRKRKTRNYRIMHFEVTDGKLLPTNEERSDEKMLMKIISID